MSVFAHELNNITEKEEELLKAFFKGFDYNGAGYTYIAHYIWRNTLCVSWEIIEGYLCLAAAKCNCPESNPIMPIPLVLGEDDERRKGLYGEGSELSISELEEIAGGVPLRRSYEPESLKAAVLECRKRFREAGREFCLTSIPGHMKVFLKEAFGDDVEFSHERDYDEYVYIKEKLITLSGRALHKKKNHLNFFLRNYEYESKELTYEMKDEILSLAAEIRDYKAQDRDEEEDITDEYEAIEEVIKLLDRPFVYGVGIYIKDKLEAFAIGEILSENLACEHFEKANDEFRGLYQLVCSEFCKSLPESIEFVNREEDMGLPGLRQAKEALKPDYMDERFEALIAETTI